MLLLKKSPSLWFPETHIFPINHNFKNFTVNRLRNNQLQVENPLNEKVKQLNQVKINFRYYLIFLQIPAALRFGLTAPYQESTTVRTKESKTWSEPLSSQFQPHLFTYMLQKKALHKWKSKQLHSQELRILKGIKAGLVILRKRTWGKLWEGEKIW